MSPTSISGGFRFGFQAVSISLADVKAILSSCFDFDEEAAEKVLSRTLPHRTDKDGGYRVLVNFVSKVIGEDVYS